ncbi:TonB-dependent receptor [Telmatospirillum siberiense]|nr:TonB-dependent receptor [Telmatospirillum siberiense]
MTKPKVLRVVQAALLGACAASTGITAEAAENLDLGTVQATSDAARGVGSSSDAEIETAPYQAPSRTPLEVGQPTSLVSQHFIENSVPSSGNYDDAIKFTPSLSNVEPNGPGLQESKIITIRGFQDGQYNIIFDGIPWLGSPTDFHHQSAVYFTQHDIGSVEVDRGPGSASTIGVATFGGTVSLKSRDPEELPTINTYSSFGSFNTAIWGTEVDSGSVKAANGAAIIADFSHETSDGYLTNASSRRANGYMKVVSPLNTNTALTVVGMYNDTFQHIPTGSTAAQIAQYGADHGLSTNARDQGYYATNYGTYNTDFEYIGLVSDLGDGWGIDNKLYTNSFYKVGYQGKDVNGAAAGTQGSSYLCSKSLGAAVCGYTPTKSYYLNGVLTTLNNDVPGKVSEQKYRSYGDIFRLSKDVGASQLKTGIWFDRATNNYSSYNVDWSKGGTTYTTSATGSAYSYLMQDWLNTAEPYVEMDWKPIPGLTITPGVKYAVVRRTVDATIDKNTGLPANEGHTWMSVLPAIQANYVLQPGWTTYAQVAKGFEAPPLDALYTNGKAASVDSTKTWNFQVGTAWQTDRLALSGDVYYIDFTNYFFETTDATTKNTVFTEAGGAIYQGVEVEGTYYLGHSVSAYANGSLNSAKYTRTGTYVAQAPKETAALGLIYNDKRGFYGSLIGKFVGPQFGQNATTTDLADQYAIGSYMYADLAVGYTLKAEQGVPAFLREIGLSLKVTNLFDNHSIVGLAGTTSDSSANTVPLWWTNPGRGFFGSVSVKF